MQLPNGSVGNFASLFSWGEKKKKKRKKGVESSTASISLPNQMKQSPVSMSSVSHGPNAARDKPTQLVLTSVKFWVAFTGRT